MGDTPLASLSLTHVHYVSYFISMVVILVILATNLILEPRGPTVLCLSMAGPDPTGTMRFLCNLDLVNKGGGSHLDVCRTAGL